ncbi:MULTISPECIES: OsmC family protein [Bacillus]|uniref:OsmC family protein n=1 Tax=Bacillus TaxID=1386 RepID=UPI00031A715F|nr:MULTISPECIES: OsmC family protein [Bacillus]
MTKHHFLLKAHWPGGRNDVGDLSCGNLKTSISVPPEMDGPGIGTNPDEMLLGAAATCYIITLAAILDNSRVEKEDLSIISEGIVLVDKGVPTYQKIIHRPTILLKSNASERDVKMTHKLAHKAETSCMISRAIRENVEMELEVTIKIATT